MVPWGHSVRQFGERRDDQPDMNEWKGQTEEPPQDNVCRIAFQNIHGLQSRLHNMETKIHELVDNMEKYSVELLGISEHNVAMANPKWRQHVVEAVNKTRPGRITQQFDSGPEVDKYGRLIGGTGIIIRGTLTGRLEPEGKGGDAMGRWSYVHLRRHRRPPVTVIAIYQVCPTPTNIIGDTAWHQQRRLLDLQQRSEHPREAFVKDLSAFIKSLQDKQHAIIVGGDWNDWLGSANSKLLHFLNNLQLVDPWVTQHPDMVDFATHERGQHRIDSVFVSQEIHNAVQSIAYTPVGRMCTSDHRAVLISFHTNVLFGATSIPLPTFRARSVRSNDRNAVTNFVNTMHQYLQDHNVFQRVKQLDKGHPEDWKLAEQLDRIIGEGGDLGEKRCLRRRREWFSRPLVQERQTVSLLRHYVNGLKVKIYRGPVIQQRLFDIGRTMTLPVDLAEAQECLHQHEAMLAELCATDEKNRRTELRQNADVATVAGQKVRAIANRKINKSEENSKTWRALKFMSDKGKMPQLDRLEIPASWPKRESHDPNNSENLEDPKTTTQWRMITNPADIEFYLMLRNYQHFGQAQGTPFTVDPLCNDIDWTATSSASEEILQGNYSNSDQINTLCRHVLRQCQGCDNQETMPAYLTKEEFKGKIKTWNEKTTTSPSGRHLGRYKALYAEGTHDPGSEERQLFQQKQSDILEVILTILNYCIKTGYPLKRWCRIVNMMIFKEVGVYKVHRLRVLHIFEADLNLLYAVKWRQLVRQADHHDRINPGQYGGRPGYEATSMALLEELRLEVSYLTRRTLLTFDNDAASCYDRIVINLASLVNRKNGLHKEITQLHGHILQRTEYQIKTAMGVSEASYRNDPSRPLYGTGQGAGNSPAIWLLISSLLFDAYDEKANGASFRTQDGTITVHMGLSGFVDDTTTVTNKFWPQSEPGMEALLNQLRDDAQLWTDLLHISGGKLEIPKCSYHALHFKFHGNGTPYVSTEQLAPMSLRDPMTGQVSTVPFLSAKVAHKILGHWKAPADKRQVMQLHHIIQKTESISLLIAASPISRNGAYLAYQGKYVASLRYVLPQCWFSETVLRRKERLSMPKIIAKCGYSSKTPLAILYAPREYAGAGFVHWATVQGEGQVRHFLKHWRSNTVVSKMLRITVSWAQWQAGVSYSILTKVDDKLSYMDSRWVKSLRQFLHHINGAFTLDDAYVPDPERQGDEYIMEVAASSGEFTDADLQVLNYCRMYLHVTTISEICNASGTKILQHMYECVRPPWFNPTTNTVIQKRPSSYQCHYQWKRFCRRICTETLHIAQQQSNTRWLKPTSQLRLRREAYLEMTPADQLYIWREGSYWKASKHPSIPHQAILHTSTTWTPTDTSVPVDVVEQHTPRRYTIHMQRTQPEVPKTPSVAAQTFEEYVHQLTPWEQSLMTHITWHQLPYEMMEYLHKTRPQGARLLLVSDGSSLERVTMSFGVVIGTSTGTILLEAMGPSSGEPSSHRAECTGCLAAIVILTHLTQYTSMPLPDNIEVQTYSDNQGMIQSLTERAKYKIGYTNTTLATDWDLLEEIHQTYQKLALPRQSYKWVQGHQDTNTTRTLTVEARYNVRADQLAGDYVQMVDRRRHDVTPMLHHTKCQLLIHGKTINGKYGTAVRRAAAKSAFDEYLQQRHGWDHQVLEGIDWEVFYMAARNYEGTSNQLLKIVHDKLPTNLMKSRYNSSVRPHCNFCSHPETLDHLCTSDCNERSIQFRLQLHDSIMNYLESVQVPQSFCEMVSSALTMWKSTGSMDLTRWQGSSRLYNQQKKIGWSQMFKGFWSVQWQKELKKALQDDMLAKWLECNAATNGSTSLHSMGKLEQTSTGPTTNDKNKTCRYPMDSITVLSRLIRITWQHKAELWRAHTEYIHRTNDHRVPPQIQELRNKIKAMHTVREQTLADHRDRYFFPDVEAYLARATVAQMTRYVDRYQPVILQSIKEAQRLATRSFRITQFFQPVARDTNQQQYPRDTEELHHRKHTRIRTYVAQRITKFFATPTKPP